MLDLSSDQYLNIAFWSAARKEITHEEALVKHA